VVREAVKQHAADLFECAPADVEIRPGGKVGIVGIPEKELTFRDISFRAHYQSGGPIIGSGSLVFDGEPFDLKEAVIENFPFSSIGTYIFGAHVVEVEVDTVTGKVEILRAWAAHDVGRAINPTAVEGQIIGGFAQGAGYALVEELLWEDGQPINASMMDYKVFGSLDLPLEIHPIIVEDPEPSGPFGAKGIGEPPLVGAAPAIANAVANAIGARLRRIPMIPERVLEALSGTGD
jgi:CO/xanthine dehydrogenase Mo-binding subunit